MGNIFLYPHVQVLNYRTLSKYDKLMLVPNTSQKRQCVPAVLWHCLLEGWGLILILKAMLSTSISYISVMSSLPERVSHNASTLQGLQRYSGKD